MHMEKHNLKTMFKELDMVYKDLADIDANYLVGNLQEEDYHKKRKNLKAKFEILKKKYGLN